MAKALSYKLALIGGLSSTLLATAAFANTTGGLSIKLIDEEGNKIDGSDLPDRACGADESFARYLLVNEGNQSVTLTDVDLVINDGDDFPFNRFIVHANRFLPIFGTKCEDGTVLPRNGGSCEIVVDLAPAATICFNVEDRGEIDRDLVIEYTSHHGDVAQNASLVEPINFEIDLEGGIEDYAVLADKLYVREIQRTGLDDLHSHLQVEQDVSVADFYANPQDIWFDEGFFRLFLHSYPAFYDAAAMADRLEDQVGDFGNCNGLTITGRTQPITGGFYCLNGTTVDGSFTFDGDEDTLFVIALNDSQDYAFGNTTPISVTLTGGVDPNNIIWLVTEDDATFNLNIAATLPVTAPNDPTTPGTKPGSVLPGVILSSGDVYITDAEIIGRVIAVSENSIFDRDDSSVAFNFYGNVDITDPEDYVFPDAVDAQIVK